MAARIICPVLGVVLIALAQVDIVGTVLHPHLESPLSNRFHRLTWRALNGLQRLLPSGARGRPFLDWALPVMIAGLILLWLLLLLGGFALVYYPWIDDPGSFSSGVHAGSPAVEAIYFSGAALTTAGFSDVQALAWPFRFLAVGEAASGVVVVSLSVAYLLAVYPALARKRAVAVALEAEVAGRPGALPMVRRYLAGDAGHEGELVARLKEWSGDILGLTESHATHPVLYYARPPEARHSFLRILVIVQSLVGLLRYGLSPDRHGGIVRDPQLLLLEQSLHYSPQQLSSSLHIPNVERGADEAERRRLADNYRRLCAELEQLGLVSALSVAKNPVPAIVESSVYAEEDGAGAGRRGGQARRPATDTADRARPRSPDSATAGDGPAAAPGADGGTLDPALDLTAASPVSAYIAFRLETDPFIAAYAAASAFTVEEARRDYETGWKEDAR
jgi:hypothetical protein